MPWDENIIRNDFAYRPSAGGDGMVQQALRTNAIEFLIAINNYIPDGKEKDQAYYRISEAIFWLTAAYDRNVPPIPDPIPTPDPTPEPDPIPNPVPEPIPDPTQPTDPTQNNDPLTDQTQGA